MWQVIATKRRTVSAKETEIALFHDEEDAREYAEYLATMGEEARIEYVREFHYIDGDD